MNAPVLETSTCRSKKCGALVAFVRSAGGQTMCLDPDPHPRGNTWVETTRGHHVAHVLSQDALSAHRAAGIELHRSHHASCPDAAKFRNR